MLEAKILLMDRMSKNTLAGLSVLIVEDVRAMRMIFRTTLRSFGINDVVEAADGAAALEILRDRKVDIVISDICMAPMDGIEFTRRLRQPNNGLNPYVPVLMVSGHTEVSRVKEAVEAGVTGFLAKPVTPANLQKKLQAIVSASPQKIKSENYCGPDRRHASARTRKRRRATDGVTAI
jgi:two-component system chemotaxis response regulator CheY